MRHHRDAARARRLPVALAIKTLAIAAAALVPVLTACDGGDESDPARPAQSLAAVALPGDLCDQVLDAVQPAGLPALQVSSHQASSGADESMGTCTLSGAGATLEVAVTSYASPDEGQLDQVLSDRTDQACRALQTGAATVTRSRFGCETKATTKVATGRRVGTSTRVTRQQALRAVARLTLSLDTGAASSSEKASAAMTEATLSAVVFRLADFDPAG